MEIKEAKKSVENRDNEHTLEFYILNLILRELENVREDITELDSKHKQLIERIEMLFGSYTKSLKKLEN